MAILRIFLSCLMVMPLSSQASLAAEVHGSNVSLAVSKKGAFVYVVILNSSDKEIRVGPMSYSGTRNDISIFGSSKENLHLSDPVEMMSGQLEMKNWAVERRLRPGQFTGVVISSDFFRKKYRESGCHDIMFAYRYVYESGNTHSGNPKVFNICW